MLFKRNAISSLMLELDSEDLPQSVRGQISNELAREVVDLVAIPECAEKLVNYEKRIIEQRGKDKNAYLMHCDLNTREVLKGYYNALFYGQDGSKMIIPDLSISELMLMLGTFQIIFERRNQVRQSYQNDLKAVKRKTSKKFGYYLKRKNGMKEIDAALYKEEMLTDDISEETSFIDVVTENIGLLEKEIYLIMGMSVEQITPECAAKLTKCSRELALSYPKIKEDYHMRYKYPKSDIALEIMTLESIVSDTFEQPIEHDGTQKGFTKLLK